MSRLSVGLVLATLLLAHAARADEESALKGIEKLGGKVTRDEARPGKPVIGIDFTSTKVTDKELKKLIAFEQLAKLYLDRTQLTDETVKALSEVGLLHTLSQARSKKGEQPRNASEVYSLDLEGTEVTNEVLTKLKGLKRLVILNLIDTRVAGAGLKDLKDFKHLTEVSLQGTKVTDATLKALSEVGLLHILTQARGKDHKRPRDAGEVIELDLYNCEVTDEGLKELRDLKQLTFLDLSLTKISDDGLKELKEFKRLNTLILHDIKLTKEAVADLQKALPNCKITR